MSIDDYVSDNAPLHDVIYPLLMMAIQDQVIDENDPDYIEFLYLVQVNSNDTSIKSSCWQGDDEWTKNYTQNYVNILRQDENILKWQKKFENDGQTMHERYGLNLKMLLEAVQDTFLEGIKEYNDSDECDCPDKNDNDKFYSNDFVKKCWV